MKKIAVELIENDMVLAQPITGQNNNILLNAGFVLNHELIPRLNSWGITHVYIGDHSDSEVKPDPSPDYTSFWDGQQDLDAVFHQRLQNEPMKQLYQSLKKNMSNHESSK